MQTTCYWRCDDFTSSFFAGQRGCTSAQTMFVDADDLRVADPRIVLKLLAKGVARIKHVKRREPVDALFVFGLPFIRGESWDVVFLDEDESEIEICVGKDGQLVFELEG